MVALKTPELIWNTKPERPEPKYLSVQRGGSSIFMLMSGEREGCYDCETCFYLCADICVYVCMCV
jgi:hypothetical protein